MRLALGLLAASIAFAQTQDPKEIIRKYVDRDLLTFDRLKN